jgi:hypothetical protein
LPAGAWRTVAGQAIHGWLPEGASDPSALAGRWFDHGCFPGMPGGNALVVQEVVL